MDNFFDTFKKMATGKLEAIGYIFIWTTSYLTISIKIAYFPLGLPENFLKKSFRKPPSWLPDGAQMVPRWSPEVPKSDVQKTCSNAYLINNYITAPLRG